jgi:hypothetical protein
MAFMVLIPVVSGGWEGSRVPSREALESNGPPGKVRRARLGYGDFLYVCQQLCSFSWPWLFTLLKKWGRLGPAAESVY